MSNALVLPSASLAGTENNSTLREILRQYVYKGGCLIIYSQQFGDQISKLNLFPEGEAVTSYGFREDCSCLKNSAYIMANETEMHPILSSFTKGIVDVGLDGYHSVNSSSSAKVLLRRKINGEPALIYFRYGEGTICYNSSFSDYSYAKSMASTEELKLVKNTLRFAMDPDNIPLFNLDEDPNPTI